MESEGGGKDEEWWRKGEGVMEGGDSGGGGRERGREGVVVLDLLFSLQCSWGSRTFVGAHFWGIMAVTGCGCLWAWSLFMGKGCHLQLPCPHLWVLGFVEGCWAVV